MYECMQSVSIDRSANTGSRGRPKQNIFKRFDTPQEKENPLKGLKTMEQKYVTGTINARERYEKEAVWRLISKYMLQKDQSGKLELGKEGNLYACTLGKGLAILIQ